MPWYFVQIFSIALIAGSAFSLFLTSQHARWMMRAQLRREVITTRAMSEMAEALEQQDYEGCVGALMEYDRTITHEWEQQDAHPFKSYRFWQQPPWPDKDWR